MLGASNLVHIVETASQTQSSDKVREGKFGAVLSQGCICRLVPDHKIQKPKSPMLVASNSEHIVETASRTQSSEKVREGNMKGCKASPLVNVYLWK